MLRRWLYQVCLLPLLAFTISTLSPAEAEAGGVILITSGNTIKHVADVGEEMKSVIREVTGTSVDYKVGYLHERIGVFWIDLWTWGGEYVLYDESEQDLWSLDDEETAAIMGVEPADLPKPLFYSFPPGLVALGAIGAVCLGMQSRTGKATLLENEAVEALLSDERYEKALTELLEHHSQKQLAASEEAASGVASQQAFEDDRVVFDRAVSKLVEQGIPYNDAYCNLNQLLETAFAADA